MAPNDDGTADKSETSKKLWGGRFTGGLDPLMVEYNDSIQIDRVLYAQDIAGSIAYARANVSTGILSVDEFRKIEAGLRAVQEEWATGVFAIRVGQDEDIHTANERRLGELIGTDIAGKLHTGRSRNDQIATDMRLWLRDGLVQIQAWLVDLLATMASRAEAELQVIMPGYTHLQRAQPIRWSHWMLSYATGLSQDLERLKQLHSRVNRSPLGFGALSGNPFGIDRVAMAQELRFDSVLPNSMAGVGDRDFVIDTLQWASLLMLHLSRRAEDLILYNSAEFGFVRLSDAYSTGSSLMPQKKNPDSLELIRGKCGRVFGNLAGLMMSVKGIPSTYNKDLQESLQAMTDTVKTVGDSIQIANGVLATLTIFPDKMTAALSPDMLATDLAEYLVRKGVPFRLTHHISGKIVALAESQQLPMDQLSVQEFKAVDERFGDDIKEVFNYERSLEQRTAVGGSSKSAVLEQIHELRKQLQNEES